MKKNFAILGVPNSLGASIRGAELGPEHIRRHLSMNGIKDFGDVQVSTCPIKDYKRKRFSCINQTNKRVTSKVKQILNSGYFPITIGGDHTLTVGAVTGIANHYGKINLIYIDAHGDFNTPNTSPSGNVHGMVLSEIGCKKYCGIRNHKKPKVNEKDIFLLGIRDLDQKEKVRLKGSKINVLGIGKLTEKNIISILNKIEGKIYLSLDIDALSPSIAPGTGLNVQNGISKKQIFSILKKLKKIDLVGFDIVEVNPKKDKDDKTSKLAAQIINYLTE